MAKKSLTLYDSTVPSGITSADEIDLNAYESAVLYVRLANKPSGNFTFNLYAHEPVTDIFSNIAGAIMSADGIQRIEIAHLREENYLLQFSAQEPGAEVTVVLIAEDK